MATTPTRSRSDRTGNHDQGAHAAGDGGPRRKRGGWLWWLLGLLALLLLGALLLGLFDGDDNGSSGEQQSAQQTATPAGASAGAGSLTARGENLLPVPGGGLADFEGAPATGERVVVQSVVKDEGFWVGSSEQDRVYVEYGGDVGANENQGVEPSVGDRVDLTGPVRPAPANPAQTLNLSTADARMVSEQGGYVNAETVEIR